MKDLYLVIQRDRNFDWTKEEIVFASEEHNLCVYACEKLTKSIKPNRDYKREYFIRGCELVNDVEEAVSIVRDYCEDNE